MIKLLELIAALVSMVAGYSIGCVLEGTPVLAIAVSFCTGVSIGVVTVKIEEVLGVRE